MSKHHFLRIAQTLPVAWLEQCARDPGPHMRPIHIALIRIALRRASR